MGSVQDCRFGFGNGLTEALQGDDDGVMPYIDLANVACGQHGGDWDVMAATIALARRHNVKIGAHPSLPGEVLRREQPRHG